MDGMDFLFIDKPESEAEREEVPQIYGCHSEAWVAATPIFEYVLGGECGKVHADLLPRALGVKAMHAFSGTPFTAFRVKEFDAVFATLRLQLEARPSSKARLTRAAECLSNWLLDSDKGDLVFRTNAQIKYDQTNQQRRENPEAYYAHKRAKDTKYRERKREQRRLVQERREAADKCQTNRIQSLDKSSACVAMY